MRRGALLLFTTAALFAAVAPAGSVVIQPGSIDACPLKFSGGQYVQVAKQAWNERKWRDHTPVGPGLQQKSRTMRYCARSRRAARRMAEIWSSYKQQFKLWARYRYAAPEEGFTGEGKWLRWLAVPRYIVECETRGYWGEGRWLAINPSGANGPAQLLGHGQPYPADTASEKVEYWEIARGLYLAEGGSPWECA